MPFRSTKTYGAERGLSCAFRQHRADSHCHLLHGYALSFRFVFEADQLDSNRWVLDFGALKPLKEQLDQWFDHKVAVARDDPLHAFFEELHARGAIEMVSLDYVGCEAFARHAWNLARDFLRLHHLDHRVRCVEVECAEHGSNSALYVANASEI